MAKSGQMAAGPRQAVPARQLAAELADGQSRALLQALHLLTPAGDLNADARRKLKQVNHFVGLLRPLLLGIGGPERPLTVIDAGTGNGYLGLVLYELLIGPAGGQLVGIESNERLADQARRRAAELGHERAHFVAAKVADYADVHEDLAVVALHACDTATDDALLLGVRQGAAAIAVVPCCQAEVARSLAANRPTDPLQPLWRHPIQRREFAAHFTNVIRALWLESHGYQVTVTELVGWEHSLKNELILARKIQRGNSQAARQLAALTQQFPTARMALLDAAPRPPYPDPKPVRPDDAREPMGT